MEESNDDITQNIISDADIRRLIGSIFPDSVILDNRFNFISISGNILETVGYTRAELQGTPISRLSSTSNIQEIIEEKLLCGYFAEERFEIRSKAGNTIMYAISGFYLGLIAEVNGMIVLKFKNLDELDLMHDRLEAKTLELDRFVYLSAHDLRGPLATMKGLINLAKICKNRKEMDFLIRQMDSFAGKLDDKLHRLIYYTESDKGDESIVRDLSLKSVCDELSTNIQEGSIDHPVHFKCLSGDPAQVFKNGEAILSLLRNLVLFFCQQQKRTDNYLILDTHFNLDTADLRLRSKGFLLSDSLKEKLSNINFGYSEILRYPELINCYAAKKIIFKLKGNIQFMVMPSHEVVVLITAVRNTQLSPL
jgi:signal transduction histidine kinase